MTVERCEACRFSHVMWREGDVIPQVDGKGRAINNIMGADFVQCRRHPPTIVDGNDNAFSLWPAVSMDDWCGEFIPKVRQ